MLDIKQAYSKLESSKKFKKEGYLCSFFIMSPIKELENQAWQIDFYSEKDDKMTSYIVSEDIKVENDNSKIFKDDKDKIHELKLDAIKTNIKEILKETNELVKKYYETPAKIIIVLQKLDETIWNISYITETFNLINIKIDASTGKKISENRSSLLSFKAD